MRTIKIFQDLINSIISNPAVLSLLPWEDLRLCLSAELQCREDLYPEHQLQSRNLLFQELMNESRQQAAEGDAKTVICSLQKIVLALQEAAYTDCLQVQANFDHACLNHYRNNTVIVLGDSHVNFFSGNEELSFLPIGGEINTCTGNSPYPFTPLHLGPCLAYNCCRYQTSSSFREKTEYLCQNFIQPHARIMCCLGEIDIRVHVFKQAVSQGRTFRQIVDDILGQYMEFLLGLQAQGYQLSCWGPIASQSESCPVDPRFPRVGTEEERNRATEYFNRQLSCLCREHGILFLSVFDKMITPDYRTKEEYLSPDRCHLGQAALPLALPEWQKLLQAVP